MAFAIEQPASHRRTVPPVFDGDDHRVSRADQSARRLADPL